jgi:hypothetical protein
VLKMPFKYRYANIVPFSSVSFPKYTYSEISQQWQTSSLIYYCPCHSIFFPFYLNWNFCYSFSQMWNSVIRKRKEKDLHSLIPLLLTLFLISFLDLMYFQSKQGRSEFNWLIYLKIIFFSKSSLLNANLGKLLDDMATTIIITASMIFYYSG